MPLLAMLAQNQQPGTVVPPTPPKPFIFPGVGGGSPGDLPYDPRFDDDVYIYGEPEPEPKRRQINFDHVVVPAVRVRAGVPRLHCSATVPEAQVTASVPGASVAAGDDD